MGMRKRYDETGKCIGAHNMVFDEIPDDYVIKRLSLMTMYLICLIWE